MKIKAMIESRLTSQRATDIIQRIMSKKTYSPDKKIECIKEVIKHTKRNDGVKYAKGFFNAHRETFVEIINAKEEEIEIDNSLLDDDYFMENYVRLFNKIEIKDDFLMCLADPDDEEEILVTERLKDE